MIGGMLPSERWTPDSSSSTMSLLLRRYWFPLWSAIKYYCFRPFSLVFHVLIRSSSPNGSPTTFTEKLEAATAARMSPAVVGSVSPTCNCNTHHTRRQQQHGLETVGAGASGQVYKVDEDIVLKSSQIFEPPTEGASTRDKWMYASETLFHNTLTNDERTVLQILQKYNYPHPNIAEAIDTHHPEGIYFRKYCQFSDVEIPSQPGRIRWYLNVLTALAHLHDIGIAHSDVRIHNILFDSQGRDAYLCDFSTCSPFGKPNLAYPYPDHQLPTEIVPTEASEKTDRFIMGSMIFQLEHGAKPRLVADSNGSLIVPDIQTGSEILDHVIRNAWVGGYHSTKQMLSDMEVLAEHHGENYRRPSMQGRPTEDLRHSIRKWRGERKDRFDCVLHAVPSEGRLHHLAQQYGWEKHGDSRFDGICVS